MKIGKNIKKYRKLLNITQNELAEKLFISRQTLSNWENDKTLPDIQSLIIISNLFEVTIDKLLKENL